MQEEIIKRKSVQKFKYAIHFNDFGKTLNLQFRCAMHYKPRKMSLTTDMRYYGCLLYVVNGSYTYTFKGGRFTAEKDDVIFLPYGSSYRYQINSKDTETMQIEFNVSNPNGEIVSLSDKPVHISQAPNKIKNLFIETVNLNNNTSFTHNFKAMSNIFNILSLVAETIEIVISQSPKRKIGPALDYIENNCEKKLYIKDLAFLCGLSESRFRKVFTDEVGMSPLEYKNYIRTQNAINLIKTQNMTTSEIAGLLGFENVYAFSQFFKNQTGISPTNYIRQGAII